MKRKSAPNDRPVIDKTIHIPLPENKLKLRTALVIALIVLAVASFAFGVNSLVGTDAGMAEITVLSGEMNAGDDFTFYYNLGFGGATPRTSGGRFAPSTPRQPRTRWRFSAPTWRPRAAATCTISTAGRMRT